MGEENGGQKYMHRTNAYYLKTVQLKKEVQLEISANARRMKAVEVTARLLASRIIKDESFNSVVDVLANLQLDMIESEADKIGLIFMAMAGYDPREAPKFWERMAAQSKGGKQPGFMLTHPSHETRIHDLNEQIPEALKYYKK